MGKRLKKIWSTTQSDDHDRLISEVTGECFIHVVEGKGIKKAKVPCEGMKLVGLGLGCGVDWDLIITKRANTKIIKKVSCGNGLSVVNENIGPTPNVGPISSGESQSGQVNLSKGGSTEVSPKRLANRSLTKRMVIHLKDQCHGLEIIQLMWVMKVRV